MQRLAAAKGDPQQGTILVKVAEPDALADGEKVTLVGFGSFIVHSRAGRTGRNPKTGDSVELNGKYVPHFKPGKELRERVNLKFQADAAGAQSENVG